MFNNLSEKLNHAFKSITGKGRITEENIKETLRTIRMSLLEADVALPIVKEFINDIKEKTIGLEVSAQLSPGQTFLKIVQQALEEMMGKSNETLNLATQPPAVVLMAGLQGAGKTTSVAKLAKRLKEKEKKSVLVVSTDIYRPAAIKQLETLATQIDVDFFGSDINQNPIDIAESALDHARKKFYDILIIDTAGRLHVDNTMMTEIKSIANAVNPIETLFVVDSMTGQDAAITAKSFNDELSLTGVILTKVDGDSRGGAALSIRKVTGKPIKFLGSGEKSDALEPFYPDRVASNILGMGDMLSLIEEVEAKIDKKKADKLAKKIHKGKGFDLSDFLEQLEQLDNMGGLMGFMTKMPGINKVPQDALNQMQDNKEMNKIKAIIRSMTPKERQFPDIIKGSRKRRIALGSGVQPQDVNRTLKQFNQMKKMMGKFKGGNMKNMMRQFSGMMPPNMMPKLKK